MAGIYIHYPFCRQACHYCNFHFSVSAGQRGDFLESLLREIEWQKDFFAPDGESASHSFIETVYLGGGTPSLLSPTELQRIFNALNQFFLIHERAEITLEANPDDLHPHYLEELAQGPVNRLSIGIQSFQPADLAYMNRSHTAGQAMESLRLGRQAGFENLSVDLIYGTPTLDDNAWEDHLQRVLDFGVPHLSAYALTVEEKTPLALFIRRGQAMPVDEESCVRQFDILMDVMDAGGYQHYEISNFALPGGISRHNLSYWQQKPYLGLGPSAHSFRGNQRCWNVPNTSRYIAALRSGRLPQDSEMLGEADQLNEYLMTSLRTMWGCDTDVVKRSWGSQRQTALLQAAKAHLAAGLLEHRNGKLLLTRRGKHMADRVASDLFQLS